METGPNMAKETTVAPRSASASTPAVSPAAPAQAAPPAAEIPLRLQLSQPAYAQYAAAAAAVGMDVEDYCREHLIQTAHIDHRSAGLWLDPASLKRVQRVVGSQVRDPVRMADKLEALARFKVNELDVALDADLVNRAKHNYRVRNQSMTVEEFLAREMVNGARTSVGLTPKR